MPLVAPTKDDIEITATMEESDVIRGVKNMAKSFEKIKDSMNTAFAGGVDKAFAQLTKLKGVVTGISSFIGNVLKKSLLVGLAIFALSFRQIATSIRESMGELIAARGGKLQKDVEEIKFKFVELRASIAAAFLPIIEAAIPYIKQLIDWLIRAVNWAGMVLAAFLGQKKVLQVIPGSAKKLADETKKTEKAAKGALAAFDQINVLQRDTAEAAKEANAPTVLTQMVPITDEVLSKVQAIKDELNKWLTDPKGSFLSFIYWDNWVAFVKQKWQEFKDFIFLDDWVAFFTRMWDVIKTEWNKVVAAFKDGGFIAAIQEAWGALIAALKTIIVGFVAFFDVEFAKKLAVFLVDPLGTIKTMFFETITAIKSVFGSALGWVMSNFINPLFEAWQGVWTGIQNFIINSINNILGFIDSLINGILEQLNRIPILGNLLPNAVPQTGTVGGRVPHLATGAVIPPNAPFAAILGDQSSGVNVEAPADLIRQIIREEMGNGGGVADITLQLDGETIYRNQQRIQTRRGKSLIAGGTV